MKQPLTARTLKDVQKSAGVRHSSDSVNFNPLERQTKHIWKRKQRGLRTNTFANFI